MLYQTSGSFLEDTLVDSLIKSCRKEGDFIIPHLHLLCILLIRNQILNPLESMTTLIWTLK